MSGNIWVVVRHKSFAPIQNTTLSIESLCRYSENYEPIVRRPLSTTDYRLRLPLGGWAEHLAILIESPETDYGDLTLVAGCSAHAPTSKQQVQAARSSVTTPQLITGGNWSHAGR
jgi:hypothetical protein